MLHAEARETIFKRATAVLTAAAVLFSVTADSWAQSNLWEERQQAKRSMSRPMLAAAGRALPDMPEARVLRGAGDLTADAPDRSDPLLLPLKHSSFLQYIPTAHATVREVHWPARPAGFVVHIQDIHGNVEAQENIALSLTEIQAAFARGHAGGRCLVGLEGAEGPFITDQFRASSDKGALERVSRLFLQKDLLTGAEFSALTAPTSPELWGIETRPLYLKHVAAVQAGFSKTAPLQAALDGLAARLSPLKEKNYAKALKDWDGVYEGYQAGSISLGDYAGAMAPALDGRFPNAALFLRAVRREKELDFKQAESDRKRLIEALAAALPPSDLQALTDRAVAFRAGRVGYAGFQETLKALALKAGVDFGGFAAFNEYVRYVELVEGIDRRSLLEELDGLERSFTEKVLASASPAAREVHAMSRDLGRLRQLAGHTLTPPAWDRARVRIAELRALPRRVAELDGAAAPDAPAFAALLRPFEDYYDAALARNGALLENLLAKRGEAAGKDVVVLVAGGFHTDGLTALLREKGYAYVVVAPRLSKVGASEYLDVFREDKTPLERLFKSDKITIVEEPAFPKSPILKGHRSEMTPRLLQAALDALKEGGGRKDSIGGVEGTVVELVNGQRVFVSLGDGKAPAGLGRPGTSLRSGEFNFYLLPASFWNRASLRFRHASNRVSSALSGVTQGWTAGTVFRRVVIVVLFATAVGLSLAGVPVLSWAVLTPLAGALALTVHRGRANVKAAEAELAALARPEEPKAAPAPAVESVQPLISPEELDALDLSKAEEVGSGASGVVYRVEWKGHTLAVKVLNEGMDITGINIFDHEKQVMEEETAKGADRPVFKKFPAFVSASQGRLAMTWIGGAPLTNYMRTRVPQDDGEVKYMTKPIDVKTAFTWTGWMLDSLKEWHALGRTHGDIKRENVHIDGLEAKFVDAAGSSLEIDGKTIRELGLPIAGSLTNTAPEAVNADQTPIAASDVYSVAALTLRMITGKGMPDGFVVPEGLGQDPSINLYAVFRDVAEKRLASVAFVPGLSDAARKVLEKGLAPNPADRYQDAAEFLQAINGLLAPPAADKAAAPAPTKAIQRPKAAAVARVDEEPPLVIVMETDEGLAALLRAPSIADATKRPPSRASMALARFAAAFGGARNVALVGVAASGLVLAGFSIASGAVAAALLAAAMLGFLVLMLAAAVEESPGATPLVLARRVVAVAAVLALTGAVRYFLRGMDVSGTAQVLFASLAGSPFMALVLRGNFAASVPAAAQPAEVGQLVQEVPTLPAAALERIFGGVLGPARTVSAGRIEFSLMQPLTGAPIAGIVVRGARVQGGYLFEARAGDEKPDAPFNEKRKLGAFMVREGERAGPEEMQGLIKTLIARQRHRGPLPDSLPVFRLADAPDLGAGLSPMGDSLFGADWVAVSVSPDGVELVRDQWPYSVRRKGDVFDVFADRGGVRQKVLSITAAPVKLVENDIRIHAFPGLVSRRIEEGLREREPLALSLNDVPRFLAGKFSQSAPVSAPAPVPAAPAAVEAAPLSIGKIPDWLRDWKDVANDLAKAAAVLVVGFGIAALVKMGVSEERFLGWFGAMPRPEVPALHVEPPHAEAPSFTALQGRDLVAGPLAEAVKEPAATPAAAAQEEKEKRAARPAPAESASAAVAQAPAPAGTSAEAGEETAVAAAGEAGPPPADAGTPESAGPPAPPDLVASAPDKQEEVPPLTLPPRPDKVALGEAVAQESKAKSALEEGKEPLPALKPRPKARHKDPFGLDYSPPKNFHHPGDKDGKDIGPYTGGLSDGALGETVLAGVGDLSSFVDTAGKRKALFAFGAFGALLRFIQSRRPTALMGGFLFSLGVLPLYMMAGDALKPFGPAIILWFAAASMLIVMAAHRFPGLAMNGWRMAQPAGFFDDFPSEGPERAPRTVSDVAPKLPSSGESGRPAVDTDLSKAVKRLFKEWEDIYVMEDGRVRCDFPKSKPYRLEASLDGEGKATLSFYLNKGFAFNDDGSSPDNLRLLSVQAVLSAAGLDFIVGDKILTLVDEFSTDAQKSPGTFPGYEIQDINNLDGIGVGGGEKQPALALVRPPSDQGLPADSAAAVPIYRTRTHRTEINNKDYFVMTVFESEGEAPPAAKFMEYYLRGDALQPPHFGNFLLATVPIDVADPKDPEKRRDLRRIIEERAELCRKDPKGYPEGGFMILSLGKNSEPIRVDFEKEPDAGKPAPETDFSPEAVARRTAASLKKLASLRHDGRAPRPRAPSPYITPRLFATSGKGEVSVGGSTRFEPIGRNYLVYETVREGETTLSFISRMEGRPRRPLATVIVKRGTLDQDDPAARDAAFAALRGALWGFLYPLARQADTDPAFPEGGYMVDDARDLGKVRRLEPSNLTQVAGMAVRTVGNMLLAVPFEPALPANDAAASEASLSTPSEWPLNKFRFLDDRYSFRWTDRLVMFVQTSPSGYEEPIAFAPLDDRPRDEAFWEAVDREVPLIDAPAALWIPDLADPARQEALKIGGLTREQQDHITALVRTLKIEPPNVNAEPDIADEEASAPEKAAAAMGAHDKGLLDLALPQGVTSERRKIPGGTVVVFTFNSKRGEVALLSGFVRDGTALDAAARDRVSSLLGELAKEALLPPLGYWMKDLTEDKPFVPLGKAALPSAQLSEVLDLLPTNLPAGTVVHLPERKAGRNGMRLIYSGLRAAVFALAGGLIVFFAMNRQPGAAQTRPTPAPAAAASVQMVSPPVAPAAVTVPAQAAARPAQTAAVEAPKIAIPAPEALRPAPAVPQLSAAERQKIAEAKAARAAKAAEDKVVEAEYKRQLAIQEDEHIGLMATSKEEIKEEIRKAQKKEAEDRKFDWEVLGLKNATPKADAITPAPAAATSAAPGRGEPKRPPVVSALPKPSAGEDYALMTWKQIMSWLVPLALFAFAAAATVWDWRAGAAVFAVGLKSFAGHEFGHITVWSLDFAAAVILGKPKPEFSFYFGREGVGVKTSSPRLLSNAFMKLGGPLAGVVIVAAAVLLGLDAMPATARMITDIFGLAPTAIHYLSFALGLPAAVGSLLPVGGHNDHEGIAQDVRSYKLEKALTGAMGQAVSLDVSKQLDARASVEAALEVFPDVPAGARFSRAYKAMTGAPDAVVYAGAATRLMVSLGGLAAAVRDEAGRAALRTLTGAAVREAAGVERRLDASWNPFSPGVSLNPRKAVLAAQAGFAASLDGGTALAPQLSLADVQAIESGKVENVAVLDRAMQFARLAWSRGTPVPIEPITRDAALAPERLARAFKTYVVRHNPDLPPAFLTTVRPGMGADLLGRAEQRPGGRLDPDRLTALSNDLGSPVGRTLVVTATPEDWISSFLVWAVTPETEKIMHDFEVFSVVDIKA